MSKREVERLLKSRGFVFGVYPEGVLCWELVVKEDDELKNKICKAFEINIETEIKTLMLQCRENFSNCLFCYNGNMFNVETKDFIESVKKLDDVRPV